MEIELYMPVTEPTGMEGINNGNIETYKNNPMLSLTKEELQNSTDNAALDENGKSKTVTVEFSDFEINPACDLLEFQYFKIRDVFTEEKRFWSAYMENDKKVVEFFDNALNIIRKPTMRCMRISDFNTTGLTGVYSQKSSPWNNLVMNVGVSDKEGNKGGSFGIGKDAAFASSQLRMVFYSTLNEEGVKASEGVIKLPSYRIGDKHYLGRGFFCRKDGMGLPIDEIKTLEPNLPPRNEVGMDKYIIGFKDDIPSNELKDSIIVSSIDNFLYAFMFDKLIVKYGNTTINSEHINELIEAYKKPEEAEEGKSYLDKLTVEYYETIKNPDKVEYLSLFEDNDVEIKVKLNPNGSRRAAVIRQSGMKVFDKDRLNGRVGFSATVVLNGNEVNKFFKKLENTEHTKWSLERADDEKVARDYYNKIFGTVRNIIAELHQEDLGDSTDAEGVNEYLPFTYVFGKKKQVENLSNEVEKKTRLPKPKKKKDIRSFVEYKIEEDEEGNIVENAVNTNDTDNPFPNPIPPINPPDNIKLDDDGEPLNFSEKENGKFKIKREIPSSEIKARLLKLDGDLYELKIISNIEIKHGYIELMISSEQQPMAIDVKTAKANDKEAEFERNKIRICDIKPGEESSLVFSLKSNEEWALEVRTNESQE